MKKTLSFAALVMIALLLIGCLTACGSKLTPGTYKLTEVTGESAAQYEIIMDKISMSVQEDGKAVITIDGNSPVEVNFDEETGKVTIEGSKIPYSAGGDTITIEDSAGKMVFKKQ